MKLYLALFFLVGLTCSQWIQQDQNDQPQSIQLPKPVVVQPQSKPESKQQTKPIPKPAKNPFQRPAHNPKPEINKSLNPFDHQNRLSDQQIDQILQARKDRRRNRNDERHSRPNPKRQEEDDELMTENTIVIIIVSVLAFLVLVRVCTKKNRRNRRKQPRHQANNHHISGSSDSIDQSIRYHQNQIIKLRNQNSIITSTESDQ